MSEPINVLLPELVVRPRGSYITYTGKETNRPSVEDYIKAKAQESRVNAANKILNQHEPDVPTVTRSVTPLNGLVGLVMSEKARRDVFGVDPYPFTCLYTATTKYGDKDAVATSNKILKRNPQKYGYEPVDMSNTEIGDLVQFSDNHLGGLAGKILGPSHGTIITDIDKEGNQKLSYSNGSIHPYEFENEYSNDTIYTMKRDRPIKWVSHELQANPSALRYVGSPTKQMEWADEYMQKFPRSSKKAEGGFLQPRDAWDNLSLAEKTEMIGVAVKNGITTLPEIRAKYNEFAEGGTTDDDLVDWIIREEGFIGSPQDIGDGKMTIGSGLTAQKWHDQYKRNGNRWTIDDNRRAVKEEVANRRKWAEKNIPNWDSLPSSSQKALLSYKYNYDFNRANSPKLFKALADSNLREVARQMDATSSNAKFKKGLQARRQREQNWFLSDVATVPTAPTVLFEQPVSTAVFNPYTQQLENTRVAPIMIPDEESYVTAHRLTEAENRKRKFQERMDAYNRFNRLLQLTSVENTAVPAFMPTTGNTFLDGLIGLTRAEGGKIHIKPENRGKFTALKERTGHSATWFKEHGTPAQKKMATFALNARHWKHGLGGNLFSGEEEGSQKMQIGLKATNGWKPYTLDDILTNAARIEQQKQAMEDRLNNVFTLSNDATSIASGRPQNKHLERKAVEGAKAHRAWEEEHPAATQWGNVLGAVPFAVAAYPLAATAGSGVVALGDAAAATSAGQAITAGLAPLATAASTSVTGAPLYTWADAGLSSLFGAHGVQTAIDEGEISPTTALELLPVTRVVKPAFNETALTIENYRYPLGRPQVPENFLTIKPQIRTKVGDVEINNPGLYYHQSDAGKAKNFVSTGRMRTPLEEYWLTKEEAGEKIPLALRSGVKPGYPQDPGSAMFSQGNLWYGLTTNKPDLLVTAREMPIANKNASIMSNKASLRKLEEQGTRRVTNDNFYTQGPHNRQNTTAYTWEPGYGYKKVFAEETPAAEWSRANNSYLDGKQEVGMYFPGGKTFDSKAFAKDLGTGIADARLFLGSDIKAATDAYNIELAKRIGYPMFTPYKEAQKRASVYIKPQITADRSTLAGSVEKNINDAALDKMTINALYDADKGGFHETLHRGNYGEEGFSFDPKTMNFMNYHKIQEDTRNFYNFKTNKLLVPRTKDNAEWYDYMSKSAEAATNSMELGRRMGIKPGAVWPGREKAMGIFEKFAASDDPKTKAFNVLNWKQKPRRVWDAITGRYFVLGAGTVSSASVLND